jgi:aldose sugar dehydrogenase
LKQCKLLTSLLESHLKTIGQVQNTAILSSNALLYITHNEVYGQKYICNSFLSYHRCLVFSYIKHIMLSHAEGLFLPILFLMALIIICSINFEVSAEPVVNDPSLQVEPVITGIKFPTSMAFLDHDDILVLEKNQGTVRRIVNGNILAEPLLDVNVANKEERGMLGIAVTKHETKNGDKLKVYVFLYYTETKSKDGEDLEDGGVVLGNRLYRYELENNRLINPKLLLDLPAVPGADHQGGVVLIGPDNNVYLVIGDVNHFNEAQNILNGKIPDGSSGILRITQDGKPVGNGILGNSYPINLYYAYGIRNSFGMDFDPVTGNLWDTENGENCCDEVNLVEPGFNSGWAKVQGNVELNQSDRLDKIGIFNETSEKEKLVDFDGKGNYSSPEFTWNYTVGPSAIKFLNSDKLGEEYKNDIFVGDVNHQNLYHFDLTENRTELLLDNKIINKTAESRKDSKDIVFAKGIGRVTDIDVGPDGNLYVLSHMWSKDNQSLPTGSIFKISKLVKKGDNATMGQETWTNYADQTLSVSKETEKPISGNGSLRVDIRPAATVEEAVNSSWSVISTDFIPVKENTYYNYSLDVFGMEVNQLHSKVYFYDSNGTGINSNFFFGGTDGTFKKEFSKSLLSPSNTKYLKIQMWVRQSAGKPASYLVDNVKIEANKFETG